MSERRSRSNLSQPLNARVERERRLRNARTPRGDTKNRRGSREPAPLPFLRERSQGSRKPAHLSPLAGRRSRERGLFDRHFAFCILHSSSALPRLAQDDPVSRARDLARAGNRAEALALLESAPRGDARGSRRADAVRNRSLVGGALRRRAAGVAQRRSTEDPTNLDARLALVRVEIWSGNADDGGGR